MSGSIWTFLFARILYNVVMTQYFILLAALLIFCAVAVEKMTSKIKMPMLLGFIALGLFIGNGSMSMIRYEDYSLTETICSCALIIVMFYGGFGTSWKEARPVAVSAGLLASLGVLATALLTSAFCIAVLGFPPLTGLLIGALICSTDAASVFSILRSRHLALKYHTDSLLEVESGSNDPMSYMLVLIILTMMKGGMTFENIVTMLVAQIALGLLAGWLVYYAAKVFLEKVELEIAGVLTIFVFACALASYASAALIGGNGYLAVYMTGILMGNAKLREKKELVHFFDGLSALMQIVIFFILGLLAKPDLLLAMLPMAFVIFLALSLFARPAAVFAILGLKKAPWQQSALVSFAGLRGAASIVFAIMAMADQAEFGLDVFHLVFGIVLFSITIQGTLLPFAARKLDMVNGEGNVLKTFNDYSEDGDLCFCQVVLDQRTPLHGHTIESLALPSGLSVALVLRNRKPLVPHGGLILHALDTLIVTGTKFESAGKLLDQERIEAQDERIGRALMDLQGDVHRIVCIKREEGYVVPDGTTILQEGDMLIFLKS